MAKNTSEIYAEMKSLLASQGFPVNDGGDMGLRLYALSAQLESLWIQADFVTRQSFPQTAEGAYLDLHAQVRGLARAEAVAARGTIRFSIDEALEQDLSIPAGVVCLTEGGLAFSTLSPATLPAGSLYCEVEAAAQEAGSGGNVPANSVRLMALAPSGVARCTNPAPFSGGAAAEGDESLRERVLASYRSLPNGANEAYYRARALDTEGVASVIVLPKNRGLGTVDLVIASADGLPPEGLVAQVQEKLDAEREICVDISVHAPEPLPVDLSALIETEEGYSFTEVKAAAEAALAAFFNGERLGRGLLLAQLGNVLFNVEGLRNYSITQPTADIEVTSFQLPTLGSLSLAEKVG